MASETIDIKGPPLLSSPTVNLYPIGSDTATISALSATEATNSKGTYLPVVTTDPTPGWYSVDLVSGGAVYAKWHVYLTNTARTAYAADYPHEVIDGRNVTANMIEIGGEAATADGAVNFQAGDVAKSGEKMDLVDAPNATAVTAIQSGLATPTNITAGTITTVSGNVDGSVNSVTTGVTVSTNNDKTGYSLSQSFPANFAALGINASGHVERVVLVDTTTENMDMRGTNDALLAASYVVPPTVGEIDAELSGAHGAGSWITADISGISTLTQSDVRDAVGLATADLDTQLGGIKDDLDIITGGDGAILATSQPNYDVPVLVRGEMDANSTKLANLDATITSRASQASVDDVPTSTEFEARTLVSANYATEASLTAAQADLDTITDNGVALATSQPNYAPAKAGDAMALTSGERTTLVGVIWDALASGLLTVGSIGKLIVDNLNAAITSRASQTSVDAIPTTISIKKNTALDAFTFPMLDADDAFVTGATVTATRSIDGASFAACANSPAEIDTTGVYAIDLSASDLNGDTILLRMAATGAKTQVFTIVTQP